jgi:hypothetical protein
VTGGGGVGDGGDEANEQRRRQGEREEWEEQVKRLPLNGCGEDREHGRKRGAAPLLVFCERRSGAGVYTVLTAPVKSLCGR